MTQQDTSGVHLWLILMKAHQALQHHAERSIQSTGLCFSDFAAMEVLLHKGPMPINTIGDKVQLTSGSLTAAVDRLEKKGYVERHAEPGDRRIRMIHLTRNGKEVIQGIFKQHSDDLENVSAGLSVQERQSLIDLLKKLGKYAESHLAS